MPRLSDTVRAVGRALGDEIVRLACEEHPELEPRAKRPATIREGQGVKGTGQQGAAPPPRPH